MRAHREGVALRSAFQGWHRTHRAHANTLAAAARCGAALRARIVFFAWRRQLSAEWRGTALANRYVHAWYLCVYKRCFRAWRERAREGRREGLRADAHRTRVVVQRWLDARLNAVMGRAAMLQCRKGARRRAVRQWRGTTLTVLRMDAITVLIVQHQQQALVLRSLTAWQGTLRDTHAMQPLLQRAEATRVKGAFGQWRIASQHRFDREQLSNAHYQDSQHRDVRGAFTAWLELSRDALRRKSALHTDRQRLLRVAMRAWGVVVHRSRDSAQLTAHIHRAALARAWGVWREAAHTTARGYRVASQSAGLGLKTILRRWRLGAKARGFARRHALRRAVGFFRSTAEYQMDVRGMLYEKEAQRRHATRRQVWESMRARVVAMHSLDAPFAGYAAAVTFATQRCKARAVLALACRAVTQREDRALQVWADQHYAYRHFAAWRRVKSRRQEQEMQVSSMRTVRAFASQAQALVAWRDAARLSLKAQQHYGASLQHRALGALMLHAFESKGARINAEHILERRRGAMLRRGVSMLGGHVKRSVAEASYYRRLLHRTTIVAPLVRAWREAAMARQATRQLRELMLRRTFGAWRDAVVRDALVRTNARRRFLGAWADVVSRKHHLAATAVLVRDNHTRVLLLAWKRTVNLKQRYEGLGLEQRAVGSVFRLWRMEALRQKLARRLCANHSAKRVVMVRAMDTIGEKVVRRRLLREKHAQLRSLEARTSTRGAFHRWAAWVGVGSRRSPALPPVTAVQAFQRTCAGRSLRRALQGWSALRRGHAQERRVLAFEQAAMETRTRRVLSQAWGAWVTMVRRRQDCVTAGTTVEKRMRKEIVVQAWAVWRRALETQRLMAHAGCTHATLALQRHFRAWAWELRARQRGLGHFTKQTSTRALGRWRLLVHRRRQSRERSAKLGRDMQVFRPETRQTLCLGFLSAPSTVRSRATLVFCFRRIRAYGQDRARKLALKDQANEFLVRRTLQRWRGTTLHGTAIATFRAWRAGRAGQRAVADWRTYTRTQRAEHHRRRVALLRWSLQAGGKVFHAWRRLAQHQTALQRRGDVIVARSDRRLLCVFVNQWRLRLYQTLRGRLDGKLADEFRSHRVAWRALRRWRVGAAVSQQRRRQLMRQQLRAAVSGVRVDWLRSAFCAWRAQVLLRKEKWAQLLLSRSFYNWRLRYRRLAEARDMLRSVSSKASSGSPSGTGGAGVLSANSTRGSRGIGGRIDTHVNDFSGSSDSLGDAGARNGGPGGDDETFEYPSFATSSSGADKADNSSSS
jgi:hypothetical protein